MAVEPQHLLKKKEEKNHKSCFVSLHDCKSDSALGRTVRLLEDCTLEGAFHCLKMYSSCFQHKTCWKDLPAKLSLVQEQASGRGDA